MTRVLVVDDEPSILRALRINLSAREYDVSTAVDGTTGLAAVARDRPDVIILDLGLPDMDGTEVIHGVRGWTSIPIIVLSAWGQESQKVAALDAGADDYVTKPFGMDELLARLRAAVRRAAPAPDEPVVTTPDFTVDLAAKQVIRSDGERRPADPDRVAAAGDPGPQQRPAGHPAAAAARGVGPGVRDGEQLPAGLPGPAAPQAGARTVPAEVPAHRVRHGLPVQGLARGGRSGPAGTAPTPALARLRARRQAYRALAELVRYTSPRNHTRTSAWLHPTTPMVPSWSL